MFGISFEHLLIVGIVLLIFGPRRLPELGQTMGKAIRNFKDALSGVEEAKFRRIEEERNASATAQALNASSGLKTQVPPTASAPSAEASNTTQI